MKLLRCYAVGHDGEWEAVCLDLCLSVQGRSFDEVRAKLDQSIAGYAEYVAELPVDEQEQFLRRRAPLSQRLEYYWTVLRSLFRYGKDDNDSHNSRVPIFCHA
jgi:hypothetical protein